MTSTQEAKLNMYNAVISYCNDSAAIFTPVPALQSAFTSFKATVASIVGTAQEKAKNISGYAMDKKNLRTALTEEAATIASKIFSYATTINDSVLQQSVNFTSRDLLRLKDEELAPVCQNIAQAAYANLANLGPYNLASANLTRFSDSIAGYTSWVPRPRNAMSLRHANTVSLRELFKAADDTLRNHLDKMISEFKMSNAAFYQPYKSNRKVVNNGKTPSQIKGVIIDNNTEKVIAGATVLVVENDTTVITDDKGRYVVKPMVPGTYSIQISMGGYVAKTITGITVKLGRIRKSNVRLLPVTAGGGE